MRHKLQIYLLLSFVKYKCRFTFVVFLVRKLKAPNIIREKAIDITVTSIAKSRFNTFILMDFRKQQI